MSHAKMNDFEAEDVLHVMLSDAPEATSVEISPTITAELNEAGALYWYRNSPCKPFYPRHDFRIDSGRI